MVSVNIPLNKLQIDTKKPKIYVFLILLSIIITGIIGIPYGDPRFIQYAIMLEFIYVALAFLILIGNRKVLYICICLAIIIIIGNSFVSAHIHRILTLARPINTIVLITGGYVLQALLIYVSVLSLRIRNN
jgi:hypothetical protein